MSDKNVTDKKLRAKCHSLVAEKCQQIRRSWSTSERSLRELRASLAQSRLAFILLQADRGTCPR